MHGSSSGDWVMVCAYCSVNGEVVVYMVAAVVMW